MDGIMENSEKRNRRVMIGTPCYDGRIDAWYANSLVETIRQSVLRNIDIFPIWLSYDALIQRARNDLAALMLDMDCDDIIFIDSDIDWNPDDFFKLLDYPVDAVGGTYRKKGDTEMYVAKVIDINKAKNPVTGLIEVEGLGTGFLRINRRAMQYLWDTSPPYEEPEYNKVRRMIFEVVVRNNDLISEDIEMCLKLRRGGFSIWLDPKITCSHTGTKRFVGDFESWLERVKNQGQSVPVVPSTIQSYGNNALNRFVDRNQVKNLYK